METKDLIIKPKRTAYIVMALLRGSISIIILAVIFGFIFFAGFASVINKESIPSALAFVLILSLLGTLFILGLVFINATIAYNKEQYILSADRIILKRGGLFSNSQTELVFRNFTFVDLKLPFIEHSLFKTGEIAIRSSGSSINTDILLTSLEDNKMVYDFIMKQMVANGFNLSQEKLVFGTYPDTIGIILNIIRKNGALTSALFFINMFVGLPLSAFANSILPFVFVAFLSLIIFVLAIVVRFLDLKKRYYQVYEGMVRYNKGFLTKHDAFIPVENISDSNSNQTFLQRIFGVYVLEISSKGIGTEIYFKNLKYGPEVEKAVKATVALYHQTNRQQTQEKTTEQGTKQPEQTNVQQVFNNSVSKGLNVDERRWNTTDFKATVKMHLLGSFVRVALSSLGIFIIFPMILFAIFSFDAKVVFETALYLFIFFIGLISNFIKQLLMVFFVNYSIEENSIKEEYKFLTTSNKEFTIQKVTGLVVSRDLIDRLVGTCSIKFISIGSSQDITFQSIGYDPEFVKAIKAKLSFVEGDKELDVFKSNFSFKKMLSNNFVGYLSLTIILAFVFGIFLFIAAIAQPPAEFLTIFLIAIFGILLLVIISSLIQYFYGTYYHKRSSLTLFQDKMLLKKGLINLSESYARFGNIKNISATKYPFITSGKLQINIAGELIPVEATQNNKNQNQQAQYTAVAMMNYGNKPFIEYVDDAFTNMDVVEEFLQHKVSATNYNRAELIARDQATILIKAKSSMANGLIPLGIVYILIPFLWIALPFTILQIYKRRYEAEQDRFVCYSGIFNINKVSVLYARIDNINIREGMFNKIFKTGTILLETIGSVSPELILENIPNYKEVYTLLKDEYKKKSVN